MEDKENGDARSRQQTHTLRKSAHFGSASFGLKSRERCLLTSSMICKSDIAALITQRGLWKLGVGVGAP
jgi:hypothetical protein